MRSISIVLIFSLGFILTACNPQVDIPSYIYVDTVTFSCQNDQGSASHQIKDVRITVDGENGDRGSFTIPALVPVLRSGSCRVQIQPVVYKNGLPQQRIVNYLYSLYDEYRNLKQGKIDTIRPHYTYADYTKFYFIEDFEDAGIKFKSDGKGIDKTADDNLLLHVVGENNHTAGIITFNEADTTRYFELKTVTPIYLTSTNVNVCLLELNCSSTQSIEVGVYFNNPVTNRAEQAVIANINKSTNIKNWRKLYINLTDYINLADFAVNSFDLYIKGYAGASNAKDTFLLDNIKIVYM